MTLRDAAAEVAEVLHRLPGVRRVILAGRDGLPLFDERTLAERDHAAAALASSLGVAAIVSDTLALGSAQGTIVVGDDAAVVVRPLECGYALAAVADADADLGDLHRRVRRHARELDEIHAALPA